MTHTVLSRLRAIAGTAGAAVLAALAFIAPAAATSGVTIEVKPKAGYEQVSLSRTGAKFFATYQVKLTSDSASIPRFRMYGLGLVYDAASADITPASIPVSVATFSATSPAGLCSAFAFNNWFVKCRVSNPVTEQVGATYPYKYVAKFDIQFESPTAGKTLRLKWATANASLASENHDNEDEHEEHDNDDDRHSFGTGGNSDITLITQDTPAITNGFKTIVPTAGGVFFTGFEVPWTDIVNPKPQGGVATKTDPFTTTVVIPPIASATTADSAEAQVCGSSFIGASCFQSDLTIPNVTLQDPNGHMTIYLRVDVTRLAFRASIAQAIINYAHVIGNAPAPLAACTVAGPSPGVPCIKARKVYPATTTTPVDWRGDWEFEIWAKDNGRFLF